MDTKTNTTATAFDADPRAAMRDFIGGYPWNRLDQIPAVDASIQEIEASGLFTKMESREAYLAWVASYKLLVKAAEVHIRAQKMQRKNRDDGARYRAQEEASYISRSVTAAIRLRRLGKRWSASRVVAHQRAA